MSNPLIPQLYMATRFRGSFWQKVCEMILQVYFYKKWTLDKSKRDNSFFCMSKKSISFSARHAYFPSRIWHFELLSLAKMYKSWIDKILVFPAGDTSFFILSTYIEVQWIGNFVYARITTYCPWNLEVTKPVFRRFNDLKALEYRHSKTKKWGFNK